MFDFFDFLNARATNTRHICCSLPADSNPELNEKQDRMPAIFVSGRHVVCILPADSNPELIKTQDGMPANFQISGCPLKKQHYVT